MKHLLNFLLLLVKSVLFIWVIAAMIILVLFFVGHEADGLTTIEKIKTAFLYGLYVGTMFGSILATYISARAWRTTIINRRVKARLAKAKNSDMGQT